EECSGASSGSDRHRAGDRALAAECASVDLHRPSARARAARVIDQKFAALFNGGASGICVCVGENQLARPNFGKGAPGPAVPAAVLDQPGKGRTGIVTSYTQLEGA